MEYKVDRMKDLYKYFGEKKEEDQEMYSIANVFYEMGTAEKYISDKDRQALEKAIRILEVTSLE